MPQKSPASTQRGRVRGGLRYRHKLSGIENVFRIDRLLQPRVERARHLARGLGPPAHFRETDSMFACDHAAPREHLREELVERLLDPRLHGRILEIRGHDIDMNVAVAGVAESRNGKSVTRLQFARELDEIDEPTPRDDDVLVELSESGCAERIAELAPERPQFLRAL